MINARSLISDIELRRPTARIIYALMVIILLVLAVAVLIPFVYAFTSGLKDSRQVFSPVFQLLPDVPQWENYTRAWELFSLPRLFANTFVLVIGGLFSQITVSMLAAYSLSKLRPMGGAFVLRMFLITLMIPSIAYIIPLYVTASRLGLLGDYWGLWLSYGVNAFMIFLFKNYFDGLPSELFDAARVDGASTLQTFLRIAVPLARPMILIQVILTFMNLWKDFLWPYLVLLGNREAQPISVFLFTLEQQSTTPPNIQMAGYFMAMLPPLVIAILLQRYLQRGVSMGAVKG